jgi:hypothetical protein
LSADFNNRVDQVQFMGQILECKCDNCKYSKKDIYLGYGMVPGIFYFPALDLHSKKVIYIDIIDLAEVVERRHLTITSAKVNKLKGDGKIPYFVKGMFKKGLIKDIPISSSPLYLQSKNNYCPKCGKYRLKFAEIGLFD